MTIERTPSEGLSPRERASEIVSLIALAIIRLHATRFSESERSLGFSAPESVHSTSSQPGV